MHRPSPPHDSDAGAPAARVTLTAFGPGVVTRTEPGGEPVVILRTGKPLAVLTFLYLAPGRAASREKLVDLLWSDVEPEAGRKQLRNALSSLRSRIGPWIVDERDRACTLSPNLESDVSAFRAAIEDGCPAHAVELYHGDFLTEFASPGASEFEHWVDGQRAYFRSMAAGAAEMCCREALHAGRFRDARAFVDRLRVIIPNSELPWRMRLETACRSGDTIGAATEAARFEDWLRTEGRDPEPASRAVLKAVREGPIDAPSGDARQPSARQLVADLVGREREFNAIVDAWQLAQSGRPQLVLVQGDPGLGKTRLIEDLKRRLRFRPERAVVVRALPGERAVPFSFVVSLVNALSRLPGAAGVSAAVVPTLLAVDPRLTDTFKGRAESETLPDLMARRALALRELIAAVCDEAPLPLLIDDFHWIDDSSRIVLLGALARTAAARALVLIASRSPVAVADGEMHATSLSLEPLSALDVENLVASIGALPAGEPWVANLVRQLTESSSGIPLLILTALHQLIDAAVLSVDDGRWVVARPGEITRVIDQIDPLSARLRALPSQQAQIIVACAIAGAPLPRTSLVALAGDSSASSAAITGLEHAGLIVTTDETIDLAHDTIGEKALQIVEPSLQHEVQQSLAFSLLGETNSRWTDLGIRLAVAAGDLDAAVPALARAVATRRRETEQPVRAIVSGILGSTADSATVTRAIRSLPLRLRTMPRRVAIVVTAAAIVGLASFRALTVRSAPPDALLELTVRDDPLHARRAMVVIRSANWSTTTALDVTWGRVAKDTFARASYGAAVAPGRDVWMSTRADSGGGDVVLAGPNGMIERLTRSRADEVPGSWAPDGKQVTIETSQFGDSGHKVVAVVDLTSRQLRPLTGERTWEFNSRWSPDGTRIAFVRTLANQNTTVCIQAVDGTPIICRSVFQDSNGMLGWIDDARLLIYHGNAVAELNADDGTHREIAGWEPGQVCDLSPDGRWLSCSLYPRGGLSDVRIYSTNDLQHPRLLRSSAGDSVASFVWRASPSGREFLDSVRIVADDDTIPLTAPSQVRAVGRSNRGNPIAVHALRWTSQDSAVAEVDSAGVIHPHRSGLVTIVASAGGWRVARRSFVIAAQATPVLLTEDWHEPLTPRWRLFGVPRPVVVHDSFIGSAFWNNGDGNYFSGAYRPDRSFSAHGGLALDAVVRLKITREQWQYFNLGFVGLRDVADLQRSWDHVTGYLPQPFEGDGGSCLAAYPAGEGPTAALRFAGTGASEVPRAAGAKLPPIALGVPTKLRIQIMPDGRCGLAVDGVPLSISPSIGNVDSLYLLTQGSSVDTRVLIGSLTVRRGVPADIDWNHLRGSSKN